MESSLCCVKCGEVCQPTLKCETTPRVTPQGWESCATCNVRADIPFVLSPRLPRDADMWGVTRCHPCEV